MVDSWNEDYHEEYIFTDKYITKDTRWFILLF